MLFVSRGADAADLDRRVKTAFEPFGKAVEVPEPVYEVLENARRQLELAQFLHDSARFYNCQFIIATHSPFLLAMPGARVYDLDAEPVTTRKWTELENVKATWEFFQRHRNEFE